MLLGLGAAAGGLALAPIAGAVAALYGVASAINGFIDDHIEKLKQSANETIAATGRVLEAAKYGFGIGYMSSVAVIAVGQVLLGNTFAAVATVATAATLTNPIAMTCAAIGAIVYGWYALNDKERADILDRLATGLEMGVELIRSLVDFVVRKTKEVLGSEQKLGEFKDYVKLQAAQFGKSLFDVTGKVGDLVVSVVEDAGKLATQGAEAVLTGGRAVSEATRNGADAAVSAARRVLGRSTDDPKDKDSPQALGNDPPKS